MMISNWVVGFGALFCCFFSTVFGDSPSLKKVFEGDFLVGSALNEKQFYEIDTQAVEIIQAQFNSVTAENTLKWEFIHPSPNEYTFEAPDQFVEFGQKNNMFIVGHTLVWHHQTPAWVFEDEKGNPIDRDTLLERLRDHIHTVVGRYKGRIHGWDVVNEALNEDGTMRASSWMQILGEDYVIKAFQFAHEADPDAQLYYNDYNLECPLKRAGAVALIQEMQENGVPITAVGLQGHNTLDWPSTQQIEDTIVTFAKLGIKVDITELDIDVLPSAWAYIDLPPSAWQYEVSRLDPAIYAYLNPYPLALPALIHQALANRYAELFQVYVKHREYISRVTFWGVTDRDSWANHIPIKRTNYPLLFDREGQPKPAFDAVISISRL